MGNQILLWFSANNYLMFVVLSIILIPYFGIWQQSSTENSARANLLRLQAAHLLFRIAFAYSLASFLQLIIRQPAPCSCVDTISHDAVGVLDHTGMPSADTAATVIVSAIIVQYVSIPVGLLFPLIYATSQVVTGFAAFNCSIIF